MKKKALTLALAVVLLVVCAVAGTLAWLTAESDTVTNTFTTSDITVKLQETKGTGTGNNKSFQMIPGYTIDKDPKAWVVDGSEDCYLFVKLTESENFRTYLTYTVDGSNWTQLTTDKDGNNITNQLVYYRKVEKNQMSNNNGSTNSFPVLANNQVTVKDTVTKADMNALTADNYPKLTITAYASQLYKTNGKEFDVAEAWEIAKPTTTP